MSIYRDLFKEFGVRSIVAFGCLLFGVVVGAIIGGGFGVLAALPFVFVGTLVMVPSITSILAQPFSSLIYPSEHLDHTLPMYSIPQSKRAKGLYEEAMTGYEEIASQYPDEVKPYIEMVNIAIVDLKNVARAKAILGRGLVLLKDESSRKILKKSFDANLTRLEEKPEWLMKQEKRGIVADKVDRTLPVDEPDGLTKNRYHPGGYIQDRKDGFVDDRTKIDRKS